MCLDGDIQQSPDRTENKAYKSGRRGLCSRSDAEAIGILAWESLKTASPWPMKSSGNPVYGNSIMAGHRDNLYLGFELGFSGMFEDANSEVMASTQLTRRLGAGTASSQTGALHV